MSTKLQQVIAKLGLVDKHPALSSCSRKHNLTGRAEMASYPKDLKELLGELKADLSDIMITETTGGVRCCDGDVMTALHRAGYSQQLGPDEDFDGERMQVGVYTQRGVLHVTTLTA